MFASINTYAQYPSFQKTVKSLLQNSVMAVTVIICTNSEHFYSMSLIPCSDHHRIYSPHNVKLNIAELLHVTLVMDTCANS